MSGEARSRWDYEGRVVEALDKAECAIARLTAALKDAERVNADLRERIDAMARQELADIPEYVALERERERLRGALETIAGGYGLSTLGMQRTAREALQEPAPQGADT